MHVTITIKEINSAFSQEYADRNHEGQESEENIKYNWEDELEVSEDVADFTIHNNTEYALEGMDGDKPFRFNIPGMCVCECKTAGGNISRFAVSRKLIRDTKKSVTKKGDVHFFFFLKDKHPHVNPFPGVYISKHDFPVELPVPEEEEISGDEEE
ncbi:MAG: hypothetical protein FD123_2809 [Bacteroidetes bacterium]|nr:MAG: hypothetical protein FD123_2809 [Bacteroidota bacterium]